MDIGKVSGVSFGRRMKSVLKTEWLKGNLSTVKRGIYSDKLTPSNLSVEHLLPKHPPRSLRGNPVRGGKSNLSNFALASREANSARGNRPLKEFVTRQQADEYLSQFKGVKTPSGFDGDEYIRKVSKTIDRLLR